MPAWRLQVYLVTDPMSQELVTALLAGVDSLVVEDVSSDFDHFVVIESMDDTHADDLLRLVQTIDPGVRLIHTSMAEPIEPAVV